MKKRINCIPPIIQAPNWFWEELLGLIAHDMGYCGDDIEDLPTYGGMQ